MNQELTPIFTSLLKKSFAEPEFTSLEDNQYGEFVKGFTDNFISSYKLDDADNKRYYESLAETTLGNYRKRNNIPRFVPTSQQSQELFERFPDLSLVDNIDEREKKVDEWRNKSFEKASALRPAEREDIGVYLDALSNSFIRESASELNQTNWAGDKAYRFAEAFLRPVHELIDKPGAERAWSKIAPEDPNRDEDFSSMLASGFGQAGMQILTAAGLSAAGAPESIPYVFGAMFGAQYMKDGYYNEMRRSGDEDKAWDASVSQIPAAFLETIGDIALIRGVTKTARGYGKAFASATTEAEKRAVLREALPSMGKATMDGFIAEFAVGGMGAEFASGYGMYKATGNENYLRSFGEVFKSGLAEGIVGAVTSGSVHSFTSGNVQTRLAEDISVLTGFQDIKTKQEGINEALKRRDFDKVISLTNGQFVDPSQFDAHLEASDTLRGRATDENGEPVAKPREKNDTSSRVPVSSPISSKARGKLLEESVNNDSEIAKLSALPSRTEEEEQKLKSLTERNNYVKGVIESINNKTYQNPTEIDLTFDDSNDAFYDGKESKEKPQRDGIHEVVLDNGEVLNSDGAVVYFDQKFQQDFNTAVAHYGKENVSIKRNVNGNTANIYINKDGKWIKTDAEASYGINPSKGSVPVSFIENEDSKSVKVKFHPTVKDSTILPANFTILEDTGDSVKVKHNDGRVFTFTGDRAVAAREMNAKREEKKQEKENKKKKTQENTNPGKAKDSSGNELPSLLDDSETGQAQKPKEEKFTQKKVNQSDPMSVLVDEELRSLSNNERRKLTPGRFERQSLAEVADKGVDLWHEGKRGRVKKDATTGRFYFEADDKTQIELNGNAESSLASVGITKGGKPGSPKEKVSLTSKTEAAKPEKKQSHKTLISSLKEKLDQIHHDSIDRLSSISGIINKLISLGVEYRVMSQEEIAKEYGENNSPGFATSDGKIVFNLDALNATNKHDLLFKILAIHESAHAGIYIVAQQNPELYAAAKENLLNNKDLLDLAREEYGKDDNGNYRFDSINQDGIFHETIRMIIEGRLTGRTTGLANSGPLKSFLQKLIDYIRNVMWRTSDRIVFQFVKNVEDVIGVTNSAIKIYNENITVNEIPANIISDFVKIINGEDVDLERYTSNQLRDLADLMRIKRDRPYIKERLLSRIKEYKPINNTSNTSIINNSQPITNENIRNVARHTELENKFNNGTITPEETAEALDLVDTSPFSLAPKKVSGDFFQRPGVFYRVIVGADAFQDILQSGEVRTNAGSKTTAGASLAERLAARPTAFPSFSKDSASMSYAKANPNHFIIVTTDSSIQPSTAGRHSAGKTHFPTDAQGNHLKSLSASKVSVYRHIGNDQYRLIYDKGNAVSTTPVGNSSNTSIINNSQPINIGDKFSFRLANELRNADDTFLGLKIANDRTLPTQNLIAKVSKSGITEFEVDSITNLINSLEDNGRVNIDELSNLVDNEPTVVINTLDFGGGPVSRRAELEHNFDTINPSWRDIVDRGNDKEINSLPASILDNIAEWMDIEETGKESATGRFDKDPYSNEVLSGAEIEPGHRLIWSGDLSLNIPLESNPIIRQKQIDNFEQVNAFAHEVKFTSQHYNRDVADNQLAFVRGGIHEYQKGNKLPDGTIAQDVTRIFEIWEVQSDWAGKGNKTGLVTEKELADAEKELLDSSEKYYKAVEDFEKTLAENKGKGIAQPSMKALNEAQDINAKAKAKFRGLQYKTLSSPLLKYWESLALKAAVNHAKKQGASNIISSDAETTMMTEGHDDVNYLDNNVDDNQIIEKYPLGYLIPLGKDGNVTATISWSSKDIIREDTGETVASLGIGNRLIISGVQTLRNPGLEPKLKEIFGDNLKLDKLEAVYSRPAEEKGMRAAYDNKYYKRMSETDANKKGLKIVPNTTDKDGVVTVELRGRIPKGLELLTNSKGKKVNVGEHNKGPSKIFKNPDGTPKNTNTGLMFPVNNSVELQFSQPITNDSESGQIGFNKKQMLKLLGPMMYNKPIAQVTVKELLQNSFDALKVSAKSTTDPLNVGIKVSLDDRTITVKDNGIGMTKDIVKKAFLTIGGTNKEGLSEGERSGGLGLAKVQFLLGAEQVDIETVRDGVKTKIKATAIELYDDNFQILTEQTNEPNGTSVTIKVPEYYEGSNGEKKKIEFPYNENYSYFSILKKPLIGNINVTYQVDNNDIQIIPIGINSPKDSGIKVTRVYSENSSIKVGDVISREEFRKNKDHIDGTNIVSPPLYSRATFDWGSADIYISSDKIMGKYGSEASHMYLSSGLYQFDSVIRSGNDKVPYDIVIDIKPNVDTASEQYPFNNQREGFKPTVLSDIKNLEEYVKAFFKQQQRNETLAVFENIKALPKIDPNNILTSEERAKLFHSFNEVKEKNTEIKRPREISNIYITKSRVIDSKTNEVIIDNTEKNYKSSFKPENKIDLSAKKDTSLLDTTVPQYHNNTNVDYTKTEGAVEFFSNIGSVFLDLTRFIGKEVRGYEVLKSEDEDVFVGVSIDKNYGGLHVKGIFHALFVNPLSFEAQNKEEAIGTALHIMLHEITHTVAWEEGAGFTTALAKLYGAFYGTGKYGYYEGLVRSVYSKHFETFKELTNQYDKRDTQNLSESFNGSKIEGSSSRSIQSNGENVSTRRSSERGLDGNTENNRGDKTGDVILHNIRKSNNNIQNSQPVTNENITEEEVIDLTSLSGESVSTVRKNQIKRINELRKRKIEAKLGPEEKSALSILKGIKALAALPDESLEKYANLMEDFIDTRSRSSDAAIERIPIEEFLSKVHELDSEAKHAWFKQQQEDFPELQGKDFDKDYNGEMDQVKAAIDSIQENDKTIGIDRVNKNREMYLDKIDALRDLIIDNIDDMKDNMLRRIDDVSFNKTDSQHLKAGTWLMQDTMDDLRQYFEDYLNSILTIDVSQSSSKDIRKTYYSLMGVAYDGYMLSANNFISSDIMSMLQNDATPLDVFSSKNKAELVTKVMSISAQMRSTMDTKGYEILNRVAGKFRESIKKSHMFQQNALIPYQKESIDKAQERSGFHYSDTHLQKIGIYALSRRIRVSEDPKAEIKRNLKQLKDSVINLSRSADKTLNNASEWYNKFIDGLFSGVLESETPLQKLEENASIIGIDDGMKGYVNDIVSFFDHFKPIARFTTEFIYGREFKDEHNYVPSMILNLNPVSGPMQYDVDDLRFDMTSSDIAERNVNVSGLSGTYDRKAQLKQNQAMVFNINHLFSNRGRLNFLDSLSAVPRREIAALFRQDSEGSKELKKFMHDEHGSKFRYHTLENAFRTMWKNEIESTQYLHEYQGLVNGVLSRWAGVVLSSAHQGVSQLISNIAPFITVNITNPGKIMDMFSAFSYAAKYRAGMLTEAQSHLYERLMFDLKNRHQDQVLDTSVNLGITKDSTWQAFKASAAAQGLSKVDKFVEKAKFFQFQEADFWSGAPMMMAEYLHQERKRLGHDIKMEDLIYNDGSYFNAIDETERFIGIGNASRRGEWLTNRNSLATIVRHILTGFAGHRLNNASNAYIEFRKILSNDVSQEEKTKSAAYIGSIAVQSAVFTAAKVFVVSNLMSLISSIIKDKDDDDEELQKLLSKTSKANAPEKKLIEAEISKRKEIRKTWEAINRRQDNSYLMTMNLTKDIVSNIFIWPNVAEPVADVFIYSTADAFEEKTFKEFKKKKLEELTTKMRNAKNLGDKVLANRFQLAIASLSSQQAVKVTMPNQGSLVPFNGMYGGAFRNIESVVKAMRDSYLGVDEFNINDFANLATVFGWSTADILRYTRVAEDLDRAETDYREKVNPTGKNK